MLAGPRHVVVHPEARAVHFEWQRRQSGFFPRPGAVGNRDRYEPVVCRQVRVVKEILGLRDWRKGQAGFLELGHQCLLGIAAKGRFDDRQQALLVSHPVVVAIQRPVGGQFVELEGGAEILPLLVAHHADKNLLRIAGLEHLVNGPGRNTHRHRRRRLARNGVLRHVLPNEENGALVQ